MKHLQIRKIIYGFLLSIILFTVSAEAETNIDLRYKYAWSDNGGWVNFGCRNCNVVVNDDYLSGYIWVENFGWINLSPSNGGVKNDGKGNLSGYAWGENIGWVDFSQVKIDSNGKFVGLAKNTVLKNINFDCSNCDVRTTWKPKNILQGGSSSSGGGGGSIISGGISAGGIGGPLPPKGGFSILINNDEIITHSLKVKLTLNGGDFNTYEMAISNLPDFSDAQKEPYKREKEWDLCRGLKECSSGVYTVYAKFFSLSSYGYPITSSIGASPVVFDKIIYIKEIKEKDKATSTFSSITEKTKKTAKKVISSIPQKIAIAMGIKKPLVETSKEKKEEIPLVFRGNFKLLTYTKTEGNLKDFSNPEFYQEIKKLFAKESKNQTNPFVALISGIGLFNRFFSILIIIILTIGGIYFFLNKRKSAKKSNLLIGQNL
jgi:hypothetical protein